MKEPKQRSRHFLVSEADYISTGKHHPTYFDYNNMRKVSDYHHRKSASELIYKNPGYDKIKFNNIYYTPTDMLQKLTALRKSIIEKLEAYHRFYQGDFLVCLIEKKGILTDTESEMLKKASNELNTEIEKYEKFVAELNDFRRPTDKNKTYYSDSCETKWSLLQQKYNKDYQAADAIVKACEDRVTTVINSCKKLVNESNDAQKLLMSFSLAIIGLPLLIAAAVTHAIDSSISHIRAALIKSGADTTLSKSQNSIEDTFIKPKENDVVYQTAFEIGKELLSDEYTLFKNQRNRLESVGFFSAPKQQQSVVAVQSNTASNDSLPVATFKG